MKAVNVDEVLKILYKYGEFLFITEYPKYREMQDEIANLPKVTINTDEVLDKIRAEIEQEYNRLSATRADETLELGECFGLKMSLKIIDKYKEESEE